MRSKIDQELVVVEDETGAISEDVNIDGYKDFAIGVSYGTNAGGNFELQASVDGSNFAQIADSVQALDTDGAYHVANCVSFNFRFLRIVMPATSATTITIQLLGK